MLKVNILTPNISVLPPITSWHCRLTASVRKGRRAVAVAGAMTWNALPTQLRHPDVTTDGFGRFLKTAMFSEY